MIRPSPTDRPNWQIWREKSSFPAKSILDSWLTENTWDGGGQFPPVRVRKMIIESVVKWVVGSVLRCHDGDLHHIPLRLKLSISSSSNALTTVRAVQHNGRSRECQASLLISVLRTHGGRVVHHHPRLPLPLPPPARLHIQDSVHCTSQNQGTDCKPLKVLNTLL